MKTRCFVALLCTVVWQLGDCDIYMHNPRGSNNRLDGANANRQNARRIFDSQNNNKGGYNVAEKDPVHRQGREENQYYMDYMMSGKAGATYLDIEWTNQHGCGDNDLNCEIVLQYMCQPHDPDQIRKPIPNRKRNGVSESGPSPYQKRYYNKKWEKVREENFRSSNPRYALHEPWAWYDKCNKRERNKGLFIADQNLKNNRETSRHTRQNAAGTQYGFECPEERDYFPYWHPTDWNDIAVLTDNKAYCPYFQKESFNVKAKGECMEKYRYDPIHFKHDSKYNHEPDCRNHGGQWIDFSNYLEKAPAQIKDQASCERAGLKWAYAYRSEEIDKHVGVIRKECVVPLQEPDCDKTPYSRSNHLGNGAGITPLTYRWKLPHFPSGKQQRCILRIRYNISTNDPRVYLKNDPIVNFMNKLPLQLAINTAQTGRTFQDRSHVFLLTPRPDTVPDDLTIYNVNIRGKRGNIVQVYPAVEYDFVPRRLSVKNDEGIHVQWGGSNRNPAGNDGQGTRGTDRNNLVEMRAPPFSFPLRGASEMLKSSKTLYNFAGGSTSVADVEVGLATSGFIRSAKDAPELDDKLNNELNNASPSYAGVLLQIQRQGEYHYMCTRNNNFSNRSEKSRLTVTQR